MMSVIIPIVSVVFTARYKCTYLLSVMLQLRLHWRRRHWWSHGSPRGCSATKIIDDVTAAVHRLPDKHCMSDMLPTRVLKTNVDLLAPFLTELFNRSLSLSSVPVLFKAAYITTQLKKPDADPADVNQYRPISNLSVL